jgi:hypothetical protein
MWYVKVLYKKERWYCIILDFLSALKSDAPCDTHKRRQFASKKRKRNIRQLTSDPDSLIILLTKLGCLRTKKTPTQKESETILLPKFLFTDKKPTLKERETV